MPTTPNPVQDASATTLAAVILLLERREQRARATFEALRHHLVMDELASTPTMTAAEDTAAIIKLSEAQARWTEAREVLATARELASLPTP